MDHKGPITVQARGARRRKADGARRGAEQYSLFAATPTSPPDDACHYRRQAELCERLLAGVHQQDLVEQLGRLHDEFEAKAAAAG